jgi:hypothetical protein
MPIPLRHAAGQSWHEGDVSAVRFAIEDNCVAHWVANGANRVKVLPSYTRISGNSAGPEDGMADKKKGMIEGGSASGTKADDKGPGKKAGGPEPAGEAAPQIAPSRKSTKKPKLAKKNKSRLPRREKKARQKGR